MALNWRRFVFDDARRWRRSVRHGDDVPSSWQKAALWLPRHSRQATAECSQWSFRLIRCDNARPCMEFLDPNFALFGWQFVQKERRRTRNV